MITYLTNLLTEKGITSDIEEDMNVDGHIGLTYEMVIDFICSMDKATQQKIRNNFVMIDFKNGDVLHFWNYIVQGMLKSLGY
jgi:hypothetical protein